MTTEKPCIDSMKCYFVTELFVNRADQDYICSRISFFHDHLPNFYWLAGQAIEKYLKASLLLNGKSAKGYGHDLVRLFNDVESYASEDFPEYLSKPEEIGPHGWREERPIEFLERIRPYTSPDFRYNLSDCILEWPQEDIFHLDQFIFAARRVAYQLDAHLIPNRRAPNDLIRKSKKSSSKVHGGQHSNMLLRQNFPFAIEDSDLGPSVFLPSHSGSNMLMVILADGVGGIFPISDRQTLAKWALKNIHMGENIKQQVKDVISSLDEAEGA